MATKADLLAEAQELGVEGVDESMTNTQIQEAIDAKKAETGADEPTVVQQESPADGSSINMEAPAENPEKAPEEAPETGEGAGERDEDGEAVEGDQGGLGATDAHAPFTASSATFDPNVPVAVSPPPVSMVSGIPALPENRALHSDDSVKTLADTSPEDRPPFLPPALRRRREMQGLPV